MIPFLSLKDVTALHGAEINEAVNRVVNGGWYLQGKENEQFEKHYSELIGCKHTIGCANGLDALIWIFRAYIEMGVMQPGDEVIVPANTYIATILAITENNLKPILVEPRFDTLEIDDGLIESKITYIVCFNRQQPVLDCTPDDALPHHGIDHIRKEGHDINSHQWQVLPSFSHKFPVLCGQHQQ